MAVNMFSHFSTSGTQDGLGEEKTRGTETIHETAISFIQQHKEQGDEQTLN